MTADTGGRLAARDELERVLHSDTFRNAEVLRSLLAYIGEKSLADPAVELKEYTIGIEACGKPESYDPQKDASVRVQVGRLRQKLEEYFQGEGASDQVVLDLPKGRFALVSRPRIRQAPPGRLARLRRLPRSTVVLLALLAVSLIWAAALWLRLQERETRLRVSNQMATVRAFAPVWGPFFSREVPSVVIFGSPGFFASARYPLFARLYDQTDPDDPKSSPEFGEVNARIGPLSGPRFDYASMGDAIAVQRLTAFFGSAGISLRALPAHLAVWETIHDSNLIFVGAWRMHPLLRRLPVTQDFELGPDSQIYNRKPQPGEQEIYTTPSHRDVMTYAVVGLYPGLKPGREVMVLTAHSSPGASAAADFITSPSSMTIVQDRIGLSASGPRKFFQMLLRIHVDNDVPVKTDYVTHHLNP